MKKGKKTIVLGATGVALAVFSWLFITQIKGPGVALTAAEQQWLKQHGNAIRYCPNPDAPPFDYVENGEHLGITADYVALIEQKLGVKFTVVHRNTWADILDGLKAGDIDLVGSTQDRAERRSYLRFTYPYYSVGNIILMRRGISNAMTLDDLKWSTIAIVDGSATYEYVAGKRPNYKILAVANAAAGFEALRQKQADAMITDRGVAAFYVEQHGYSDIEITGEIDYVWKLRFASAARLPELGPIIDKALDSITPFQRIDINRRWMAREEKEKFLTLIIIGCLLFTLLAAGTFTVWNRILRRQVKHRTHELGRIRQSHQQATRALGESEDRFRALVESSNDMIWEMDRFGNYTYVSPRVRDILGFEPRQVTGQSALSLMVPADSAKNLQKLRKATAATTITCEINTHAHKDGRKVILESSGMAFADNTGNLAGFRGVSRDITARVKAEAALKESEERFRNLVETTSDWIWEVDTDGRFIYASPQASDMLGYTPNELIGKRLMDLMPPKEAIAAEAIFKDIVAQGAPIPSMVNINKHKSGRTVVLETSAVPFYDKDWKIMGYRGIGRDITDRMAAEKQLEFERNLFRSFMQHAPDLIYFKDRDGRFIEVNAAKAAEVHLDPDELVGKTDFDLLPHMEAQRKFDDDLEVMRTETPLQKEESTTTPDGIRWYLTTKVPRYDEKGQVVGTFGTSWDITNRKNAEEELRRLRALLGNIIDSMPSILVGVDLDGRITQWNREAERATQTLESDANGKLLKEIFPRLAKEMVKVERAIRERTTQKEERIPVHEGTRTRYNDVTVYPLLDNDAEGAVIRVDDVTDRVLIEDSIRNIVEGVSAVGRQFFNSMVSQLAKALGADFTYISEFGGDTRDTMHTIAVSDRGEIRENFDYALHGTPCERVLGGETCLFVSDVQRHFPATSMLQTMGIESYIGISLVDSEKKPLGVMVALYRKPIEQLEFVKSVMQVFAGRTAAELERLQATKELLTLRNLLSNIINSMPSILVGVDAEGHVMQWNHEAERISGLKAGKAQGKMLSEVFPDLGSEMTRVLGTIGSRKLQHNERIPCLINNETHFTDVTVYPLTTEGADGAVIRIDDVTDRVRIEEMMVQSEKMMSVGGLAAGMAHEINNPLAGILQNLQVMRNRIVDMTDRNMSAAAAAGTSLEAIQHYMQERGLLKMMDSVTEAGRRAAKIVDNMLSFSRKDEAHFEPNDLKEILERSLELASNDYNLKKRFDFRHIKIVRDYDDTLGLVPCESSQIQQVILNLLSNSAQAMAEHQPPSKEPRITLRLKRKETMVLIEVEDNGPGMDAETRKRAFEPFFTTKEVGHGTGLGLSVSYFIITENHGGTMRVDSSPGKGARFSIRIPFEHRKTMIGLRL
ncbi:MAG: PAS domain S-box protein [Kiritimatiellales bacterium]|nr:PAS domain S-box protein [Kiritimatiellales bacterium]